MHKFHLRKELILDILSMCSGIANSGRPTRKCAGVNTTIPSIGVESNGTSGLMFMVASTYAKTVNISSIVRIHEPTTLARRDFIVFTSASQSPPKCDALLGI